MIDWGNSLEAIKYIRTLCGDKPYRHRYYLQTVEHAEHLAIHVQGKNPKDLLLERRPNEPEEIQKYRQKIYRPITKSRTKKVLNVLARINNSKNYRIIFPPPSTKVKTESEDNSLEKYIESDYPYWDSYIQWVFDIGLRQMVSDPNACLAFLPKNLIELSEDDAVLPEPFGVVYYSRQVVDYSEYHTTFLKDEKSLVTKGQTQVLEGDIFCVYTDTQIIEYRQYGKKEDLMFDEIILYTHNLGTPPVIKLGGEYIENSYPFIYESFISGVLPYWDDAVREYSDKQSVFVQHVYPERVEMAVACDHPLCGADGAEPGFICDGERKGKFYRCPRCKGEGMITGRSPYGVTKVKKSELSVENPIFPGVQYIDKPTDIVTLLKEDIEDLINDGYSALNMDFLAEVPLSQSGVAKNYDRAELTSFLLSVSTMIFDGMISKGIWIINGMRYNTILSQVELEAQYPVIIKPQDFDIQSLNQMVSEFGQSQNLPRELKDEMTVEIMAKKYAGDKDKQDFYRACIELDPLRGKTSDEKFTAFSNGVVSKVDYSISENISKLISTASEDPEFYNKPYKEQYAILVKLAEVEEKKKIELFDEDEE